MSWPDYIQKHVDTANAARRAASTENNSSAGTTAPVASNTSIPSSERAIADTPTYNERQIWGSGRPPDHIVTTAADDDSSANQATTRTGLDPSDRKFFVNDSEALARWDNDYANQLEQKASQVGRQVVEPTAALDPLNNLDDQQALAQQYAPILVLPEGRNDNLPASADEFIEYSRLRQDDRFRDTEHGNNINADPSDDFTAADLPDLTSDYHLDLADDKHYELGRDHDENPAPVYYELQEVDGTPMLTYFFFYAYNDGPSFQNHEADWESMTLELDPETFEPTTARYSSHHHRRDVPFDENIIDPVTGRPVVYVASGSHASFPAAGEYRSEVPVYNTVSNDKTVPNPNNVPIRELEGAVIYENWSEVLDVEQQAWYPNGDNPGVSWGENGSSSLGRSGITGPSSSKGHVTNPVRDEGPGEGTRISDFAPRPVTPLPPFTGN